MVVLKTKNKGAKMETKVGVIRKITDIKEPVRRPKQTEEEWQTQLKKYEADKKDGYDRKLFILVSEYQDIESEIVEYQALYSTKIKETEELEVGQKIEIIGRTYFLNNKLGFNKNAIIKKL